jgi:3-hydroxybutyryl-CoA dehydrogenase
MSDTIQRAFVLGAGTMGAGIAEVSARAGIETVLFDVNADAVKRGLGNIEKSLARAVEKGKLSADESERVRGRLRAVTTLDDAARADLVVEAVPEDMALKKKLFAELSAANGLGILASNTSSLSVTEIAAASTRPERVIGLHFFNPPPIMPLLEIVRAEQTSAATLEAALAYAKRIGKDPIVVADSPGFATSRLGIILGMEAIRMLEAGVASAADIDKAMELGYKHPMGPLKLTDLVGLDVRLAIAEHLTKELGPQFTPPPLLRRLVRAGKVGKKSGEGFYRWVDGNAVPKS